MFLRDPKAWNDCDAACKEWKERAGSARGPRIIQKLAAAAKPKLRIGASGN